MEPACRSPRVSIDEASMSGSLENVPKVPAADVWELVWGKLRNIWYYIYVYVYMYRWNYSYRSICGYNNIIYRYIDIEKSKINHELIYKLVDSPSM